MVQYKNNQLACGVIVLGVVISILLSPFDKYFFGNFTFFWGPQAIVLVVLASAKMKTELIAGASLIMLIYLCVFYFLAKNSEPMIWLFYIFSCPGILVGAFAIGFITQDETASSTFRLFAYGFGSSFIGLLLNVAVIYFVS
ncbi:hypothetical protein [Pseudoalteromonas luteoviolacea]|uniref:hypothetical protein n=1 Tax=Pseudoalteromonas luteoviolacea TaxID=43657 RepID=UPI001B376D98|nr:hypothetical protein [Pseudoalteromonas luteoviolacea]MBQ4834847.1 hypothetical protein [Pseudoalteromonas luteoviolacea]